MHPVSPAIGGELHEFHWNWRKQSITATYEVLGSGQPILLLPAFSSISTRGEMHGLATRLAERFQVITLDWVGFGDSARPGISYSPEVYHAFLKDFVRAVFREPVVVIAAGHAAGYVMQLAQKSRAAWSWIVLVAPTWRGPLPTAMGEHRWFYRLLRELINLPLIGQLLYWLNTSPWFLRWMAARHVFANPTFFTPALMQEKWQTTQRRGGRFASAAFVTGGLDPVRQRSQFFDYFQPPLPAPVMLVIGEQTPVKSLAEMEILAHFSGVGMQILRLPGSLALHEEYADQLADSILPFLNKYLSQRS
ncbi:MAG: alpha/beta hydrolase [Pegethrix bostrychoides GSE-TBD4-15B]|jgi:pimeloyl-ACP methyl ester carboxylesterase|uniref:Alpha/beta hydrolase n=1 Tax=Pegethrix bostrychoides GSE-TBD4-15B TaxID=2839662 RepID=A0A951U2Z8_9CYAN|nr:alpha/beta hydrolase [Pegethrix bostrychoides GSE-TBD4-15B]